GAACGPEAVSVQLLTPTLSRGYGWFLFQRAGRGSRGWESDRDLKAAWNVPDSSGTIQQDCMGDIVGLARVYRQVKFGRLANLGRFLRVGKEPKPHSPISREPHSNPDSPGNAGAEAAPAAGNCDKNGSLIHAGGAGSLPGGHTVGAGGRRMKSEKERAFGWLVCGVVLAGTFLAGVATHPEDFFRHPARFLLFSLLVVGCALLMCRSGWDRLARAKRAFPLQSWGAFLHEQLIVAAIGLVAVAILTAVGEAGCEAPLRFLTEALRFLVEVRTSFPPFP